MDDLDPRPGHDLAAAYQRAVARYFARFHDAPLLHDPTPRLRTFDLTHQDRQLLKVLRIRPD